ncbi:MAG: VWA domain-containing protein [Acidobacteriaceae bacterium]
MGAQWKLCLVLVGCGASALAQKPLDVPPVATPAPASSSQPMTLDVVVTDKAGNVIRGLKREDFTLLDNKQPAAIRSFRAHEIETPDNDPQALMLVIDDVNTNFSTVSIARTQIENFLRSNGGHLAIPAGIYLLTDSGLSQVTEISSDGNKLADVLHQKEGSLHNIPRSAGFYGAEERVEISLKALADLGDYLGHASGRKLVVWIGPGWPIFDNPNVIVSPQQQRNFFSGIVGLSSALQAAGITLYSIDPLGTADAASDRTFLWESFLKPVTKPTKADPGDLALQVFAMHSGGTVVSGSNDITGEIAKCARDASAWYSMSFDPQRPDAPNTWHDLAVKVDKPGVKVRTINGYYAQP